MHTQWKQLKSVTGTMRPDRLDPVEGARTRGRQTGGTDGGLVRQKETVLFWLDGWVREEADTGEPRRWGPAAVLRLQVLPNVKAVVLTAIKCPPL